MADSSSIYYPVLGVNRWTGLTTFTAASASADYPASNLGRLPLAAIWESTSVSGQWVKGELDRERPMRLFLIGRHNGSNNSTFRLRIFSDGAATQANLVYDTDADDALIGGNHLVPVTYEDELLEWEDDAFFDGKYTPDQKQDAILYRPIFLSEVQMGLSWRLDFTDPDNADGKFRIGMIDVSNARQLTRGAQIGGLSKFEVRTRSVTAYGGTTYHERLTKKWTQQVALSHLPRWESRGVIYELMRQHDLDTPFAFLRDPRDTYNWLRDCKLVENNKDLSPLARAARAYESTELNLIEVF